MNDPSSGPTRSTLSTPISPERWRKLEPLIDAVLDVAPERRSAFLSEACGGDSALRADAELLLGYHDRRDMLFDGPPAERFGGLFAAGIASIPKVLAGKYRIERELGRGGMATVYLARDLRHERNVAVKVLHPHIAAALGIERFLTEIKTTARLQDPHILALHDSGEADGFVFYVMPYVEGGSLRRRLERDKQLPVEEAIRLACEVASALEAAHREGVIHRDVKPENILLQNGTALVADFGIALAMSAARAPRMTAPGSHIGTPEYMSPEQASDESQVDGRADLYALGTVVYEMLAGETPFTGTTTAAILAKRAVTPAPPLRSVRADVPAATAAVVARALTREPADRYGDAGEFARALQKSLVGSTSSEGRAASRRIDPPAGKVDASVLPRRRSVLIAGVAFAALAALLLASRTARRADSTRLLDPNKIVVLPFTVTGADSSWNYLGEGVAVLLAPLLTGEGGPLAVDSRTAINTWHQVNGGRAVASDVSRDVARRLGAGKALLGNLLVASGQLTLTANIVDPDRGESRPLQPVRGSVDSLQSILDGLLRQLLVRHAGVPERTIGELTSQSIPALRAYLDGRAAFRRAHNAEAIPFFNRALDADSTFALAALDLATATHRLVRQPICAARECGYASMTSGIRELGSRTDDEAFDRGVRLAWKSRAKLGRRDLPMLEALRGSHYPMISDARETFDNLERASAAAPDRADTKYLIGLILLHQGYAIRVLEPLVLSEAFFNEALRLDPAYLAPIARLVDVAAYEGDSAKLRRIGLQYLSRDSTGATADYVRWRVGVGTNDAAMLRAIHARFDSLDLTTLKQIVTASQQSGVALDDGDRAATLVIDRTTNALERRSALYFAHEYALNRGWPHRADSLLRLRRELFPTPVEFWRSSTLAALFADGDSASAEASSRERERWLVQDTLGNIPLSPTTIGDVSHQMLWDWKHGRLDEAEAIADWLQRHLDPKRPYDLAHVDVAKMLVASSRHSSDAPALRARVDSEAGGGCCKVPMTIELSLATAYELAGNDSAALRVLRRGKWASPSRLSTFLLREGRVAARLGDRAGAMRAYERYLALRSNPEPRLVPQRDSVQAALNGLRDEKNRGVIARAGRSLGLSSR